MKLLLIIALATIIPGLLFGWVRSAAQLREVRAWCKEQKPTLSIPGWSVDHRPEFCRKGEDDAWN